MVGAGPATNAASVDEGTKGLPVILDTDPGIDDALAFLYLVRSPELRLLAVTAVAGNVPLERTFANARGLAALLGIESGVPVYAGCSKPLTRPLRTGEEMHGEDGMGGVPLPEPRIPAREEHAATAIVELSREWPGELKIVALGPLTNIATALTLDPDIARRAELIFMGGAANVPGNVPPGAAEFNAWVDPEALELVVGSGIPFTMVGLDATERALISRPHLDRLGASTPTGVFASRLLESYLAASIRLTGRAECAMHDPLAVAVAADPGWVRLERGNLYVETKGAYSFGATLFFSGSWREREGPVGLDADQGQGLAATGLRDGGFADHLISVLSQELPPKH